MSSSLASMGRRGAPSLLVGVVAAAGIGLGVTLVPSSLDLADALIAVLGLTGGLVVVRAGPIACVAAIGALAFLGLTPSLVQVGQVDLRLDDVFFILLVGWAIRDRKTLGIRRAGRVIDFRAGMLLLGLAGLSVFRIAFVEPDLFGLSLTSWLRLIQTVSLAWLVSLFVVSRDQVDVLIRIFSAAGLASVALAIYEAAAAGALNLSTRHGGLLNENAFGLLCGFLIVFALFSRMGTAPRAITGLGGLVGLLLAKSIGSTLGMSVAVGIGLIWLSRSSYSRLSPRHVVLVGLLGTGLLAGVFSLRSDSLPGSESFRSSSAYHRVILGAAGVEIFLDNPLVGVGWQRSSAVTVIGGDEVALTLRERYPDVNNYLYPELVPSNVHNAYIQILAELGVVGFILFAAAVLAVAKGVMGTVRPLAAEDELVPNVRALALCLLLVLVWWNDNAIFGGQTESVTAALFLGMITGIARTQRERRQIDGSTGG